MKKTKVITGAVTIFMFLFLAAVNNGCMLEFKNLDGSKTNSDNGQTIVGGEELQNIEPTGNKIPENILPVTVINIFQHGSGDDYFKVGSPVYFSAGGPPDASGDVLKYTWQIGDEEVIYGEKVSYVFDHTGEYIIILTVDDRNDPVKISRKIYLVEINQNILVTGSYEVTVGIEYVITNNSPLGIEDVVCLIQVPQTYRPFQVINGRKSNYGEMDEVYSDDYNIIAKFNLGDLPPGESANAYINCDAILCEYEYLQSGNGLNESYNPGDKDLALYTGAEYYIDSDSRQIKSTVKTVVGEETEPILIAERLYDYVANRMVYDEEKLEEKVKSYRYASDIINSGKGVCTDYTILFIALCREAGIPAKFVQGVPVFSILEEGNGSLQYGHAWAEIKLPGYGWVPVDITTESGFMSYNYYLNMETYKGSGVFYRSILIDGVNYYPGGFYYSWEGNVEPDVLKGTTYKVSGLDIQDTAIINEDRFLESVGNTLSEYNAAINHVNLAHSEEWIFNDPGEIAVEETFLVRLEELSKELEEISYPESYASDRNTLVEISYRIIQHKEEQIKCMRSDNYECSMNEHTLFIGLLTELFDYYANMIKSFNQKY